MRIVTSVLALSAPASAATCPAAGDLATGIRVTYADSSTELFRDAGPNLVEARTGGATRAQVDTLARGVYLLHAGGQEDGKELGAISVDYGRPVRAMPVPEARSNWRVDVVETLAGDPESLRERYAWGPVRNVRIGPCEMRAIEGKLTRRPAHLPIDQIEFMRYFPDLGFAQVTGIKDPGLPPDRYVTRRIEAIR